MTNSTEVVMSRSESNTSETNSSSSSRVNAYVELTKMRISVMVLITFAVAGVLAAHASGVVMADAGFVGTLLVAMVGMLLIASSGNAMNMYIERYSDYLMPRTAGRPLPAQKLSATEVALFAAITFSVGTVVLFTLVNWQTGVCGVLNWVLYSFVYTPLKTKHWSNTEVGAVAGAMPVLMGSLAMTETVGLIGWAFFGVLFFWQFPHFMAIAWIYRDQYANAGARMLTVVEPTGRLAGLQAVTSAALLVPLSLFPAVMMKTGPVYFAIALLLSVAQLLTSAGFLWRPNDRTARRLLRMSLVFLPVLFGLLCLSPFVFPWI
jgi:protoheme IX farnesyltransferase